MRLTAHRSISSGWSALTGYLYLPPPLVLAPELDETNQLYCLTNLGPKKVFRGSKDMLMRLKVFLSKMFGLILNLSTISLLSE